MIKKDIQTLLTKWDQFYPTFSKYKMEDLVEEYERLTSLLENNWSEELEDQVCRLSVLLESFGQID